MLGLRHRKPRASRHLLIAQFLDADEESMLKYACFVEPERKALHLCIVRGLVRLVQTFQERLSSFAGSTYSLFEVLDV